METVTGHKLVRSVKDPSFSLESLSGYNLILQIGINDLQLAVIDPFFNNVLVFEDYVFADIDSDEELLLVTHQLYDAHEFLAAGFWKEVIISFKNSKFVQVPEQLFHKKAGLEYLKFNSRIDPVSEITFSSRSAESDAVTVYASNAALVNWLKSVYKHTSCRFTHQATALIAAAVRFDMARSALFIFIDRFQLHVLSVNSGKLQYYNQFQVKEFSDYTKYILLVMNSLQLSQNDTQIILWGFTGKSSPHYQEFEKYIRKVKLGDRLSNLKFKGIFDSISSHQFIDLFAIPLTVA